MTKELVPDDGLTPDRLSPQIGRLQIQRASDVYADQLRDRILSGVVPPGSMLPPERQLAEESGLSRAAIRDALTVLAVEGLVSSKVGRGGGSRVQQPPQASVVRTMDVFIRGRGIRAPALLETRDLIEPRCALLAAERRTPAQLQGLRALTEQMATQVHDVGAFLDANVQWHMLVAEASGNEILATIMTAISANIRAFIGIDKYESDLMMVAAQGLHERILSAIDAQDAERASDLMGRHLQAANSVVATPVEASDVTSKRYGWLT